MRILADTPGLAPQPPFTPTPSGWWQLPAHTPLAEAERPHDIAPPYPGLLPLGTTDDDGDEALLMLNLAPHRALLLDGDPASVAEVVTELALKAAATFWADHLEIITVGLTRDLPALPPGGQHTPLRQGAQALHHLSQRLLEDHQHPGPAAGPYRLVLAATPLHDSVAGQFARLLAQSATASATLIAPADTLAPHFPHAPVLDASTSRPQRLPGLDHPITLLRPHPDTGYGNCPATDHTDLLADQPADTPSDTTDNSHRSEPDGEHTTRPATATSSTTGIDAFPALTDAHRRTQQPSRPQPSSATQPGTQPDPGPTDPADALTGACSADACPAAHRKPANAAPPTGHDGRAPEIRVLGPIEVDGLGHTGHGPRTAQLAALLYFRPGRTADALCTAMDPTTPWTTTTLNARVQGLRRALGNDPTGHLYVPRRHSGDDPYRLHPAVRCDWTTFQRLTQDALHQGPSGLPDLEKALSLVRGRPFADQPPLWAEPHQQEMITAIVDVAHTVATHRTPPGPHHNLRTARHAVTVGLDIDDTSELLYRDWLTIEAAAGNRPGLHTALTRLQHLNRTLNAPLEEETEQLIAHLLTPHPGHAEPPSR
ncbi:hypothetical protein [Streptomyces sp. NPDC086766]|uniref:AfsR/SARP family transcriptional regulator n=1 Tax=Streptomyces sp. NPDC086766 TaxID=3365754 RepID=UPI00381168BF